MEFHGGLKNSLELCYPELQFDPTWEPGMYTLLLSTLLSLREVSTHLFYNKVKKKPKDYWADPHHCKQFFDELAANNGFDPLQPLNWKNLTQNNICIYRVLLHIFMPFFFLNTLTIM